MNRRKFIRNTSLAASTLALAPTISWAAGTKFPFVRAPVAKRQFTSPAVEKAIAKVQSSIGIGLSLLGTSEAIALGAYAFALKRI